MNERRRRNNIQKDFNAEGSINRRQKQEQNYSTRSQSRVYNLEFDSTKKTAPKSENNRKGREYKLIDFSTKNSSNEISSKNYNVYANPKNSMDEFKRVKKIIDEESMNVKKKKKRKKKKGKYFFIFKTALLAFLALIVLCTILVFTLPLFDLKKVEIIGTEKYTAEDIAGSINLKLSENIFISMFRANKDKVQNEFPYIEDLKIKYRFPNTVRLVVHEREDRYYALNKENSKYYIIDKNGYILDKRDDTSSWEDQILVSGVTFENKVVLGDKINDIDIKRLNSFENFYNAILSNLEGSSVTRVTFVNEYMKIYVNSSVEIVFETRKDVSEYSFQLLKLILKDIEGQKGTIDMTRENPTFVKDN